MLAIILAFFVIWQGIQNQPKRETEAPKGASESPTSQDEIIFFLVAYGGEVEEKDLPAVFEKFGCEDLLVPYKTKTEEEVSLKAALDLLFTQKDTFLPNGVPLHNALLGAKVTIDVIEEKDKTSVNLVGKIPIAGVCDTPRIKQQIEKTVWYYAPGAVILYNDSESSWRCLGDQSGLCQ